MNLLRLLIVIALAWMAYRMLKRFLATRNRRQTRPTMVADTVRCQQCGTYVPKSSAVSLGGKWYCEQHQIEERE